MPRFIIAIALAIALTPAASAPAIAQDAAERPIVSKEDPRPIVRVNLQPAAVPNPPLKYPLLPPYLEQTEGNAAHLYRRALANWESTWHAHKTLRRDIVRWWETPFADVPLDEARNALKNTRHILDEVDAAARRERCEWGLSIRGNREIVALLTPESLDARSLARLLTLRARLQALDGDFDGAVYSIQSGYALARHVGEIPLLVSSLSAMSVAGLIAKPVEEMREMPGSPNLFWSLAALPRPLIDSRRAVEVEMVLLHQMFPAFREARTASRADDEWQVVFESEMERYRKMLGMMVFEKRPAESDGALGPLGDKAALGLLAMNAYPAAKLRLIERGRAADDVERMPVARVLMIDIADTWDEAVQQDAKWYHVPPAEAPANDPRRRWKKIDPDRDFAFVTSIVPAMQAVRGAQDRLDRQIALMQLIEAVRHYAAIHEGRLPAQLGDIEELPLPDDPITGKPFEYRLEGDSAVIDVRDPTSDGYGVHVQGARYVLTIAK
ncbi:MAG: hypothetical protein WD066_10250 [Planctomycetaceae bacterium]